MGYRLVVGNKVKVPVELNINDDGENRKFKFFLKCKRLDTNEMKDLSNDGELLMSDFMRDVTEGWDGQKLVVDENGNPADFSDEAFDLMLRTPGAAVIFYGAYLRECTAKEKNLQQPRR